MIDNRLKLWLKNELGIDFKNMEELPIQLQLVNRSRKQ